MSPVGTRIRQLRKERNMTLQYLAGDKLTKGMLSLIENGKAQPSMDSLTYIAERLGVETMTLLQDISPKELQQTLEKVEELFDKKRTITQPHGKEILELIEPLLSKLNVGYESARLLEIYSRCAFVLKQPDWKEHNAKAREIYERLHIYNRSADLAIFHAMSYFLTHHYSEALDCMLKETPYFKEHEMQIDTVTMLDYLYIVIILYLAVGDLDHAMIQMEKALHYSKEERVFYRIDDLYRILAFQAIMDGDDEKHQYYFTKLRQYAEFAEYKEGHEVLYILEAHYHNSYTHRHDLADEFIEKFKEISKEEDWDLYYLEKGKVCYGFGDFENALTCFAKYQIPAYIHHPYDLAMNYEKYTYEALSYEKLGETARAKDVLLKGLALMEPLPNTPYKEFMIKVAKQFGLR